MSKDEYEEDCPGCKPAMMDMKTGNVLADDHPLMKLLLSIWAKTSLEERQAYHRVMCQDSREPKDLELVSGVMARFEASASEAEAKTNLH